MKMKSNPRIPMWTASLKSGVNIIVGTNLDGNIVLRTTFAKEKKKRQIPARQLTLTPNSATILCGLLMAELNINSPAEAYDRVDKSKVILPPQQINND